MRSWGATLGGGRRGGKLIEKLPACPHQYRAEPFPSYIDNHRKRAICAGYTMHVGMLMTVDRRAGEAGRVWVHLRHALCVPAGVRISRPLAVAMGAGLSSHARMHAHEHNTNRSLQTQCCSRATAANVSYLVLQEFLRNQGNPSGVAPKKVQYIAV